MSATLSGIEKIQNWLNTEIFECKFRPVPLSEHILCDSKLTNANSQLLIDLK
jgi:DNA polymerase theta